MSDSMELFDKIVALSDLTHIPVGRMSLDITLSQAMTEENRADMTAFIRGNSGLTADQRMTRSPSWVLAQVMHDINGFKEEHLSDEPTGFVARTSGTHKRPQIIIFVDKGLVSGACSTVPDIEVTVADKDNVETEEEEAAYNKLVDISNGDEYTAVY